MEENGLRVTPLDHYMKHGNSRKHMLRKDSGVFLLILRYECQFPADDSTVEYPHAVVFDANNKLLGDNAPYNPRYKVQPCNTWTNCRAYRLFADFLRWKHDAKTKCEITNIFLDYSYEISKK